MLMDTVNACSRQHHQHLNPLLIVLSWYTDLLHETLSRALGFCSTSDPPLKPSSFYRHIKYTFSHLWAPVRSQREKKCYQGVPTKETTTSVSPQN